MMMIIIILSSFLIKIENFDEELQKKIIQFQWITNKYRKFGTPYFNKYFGNKCSRCKIYWKVLLIFLKHLCKSRYF